MAQTYTMIGIRRLTRTLMTAANNGANARTMKRPIKFPPQQLPMRPQTNSLCSTKSIGPGVSPKIMRPPMMTAIVGEPGIPRVTMGSVADVPAPWAADSGAMIPAEAPCPHSSLLLADCLANPYAMKEAGVGPPGFGPIQHPMTDPMLSAFLFRPISLNPSVPSFHLTLAM